MSTGNLKEAILNAAFEAAAHHGFERRRQKKSQSVVRYERWATFSLHLSFAPRVQGFCVDPSVAVRFDGVETLADTYDPDVLKRPNSPSVKAQAATIGARVGNIAGNTGLWWNVAEEGEIPQMVEELMASFVEHGLPYLERHGDPDYAFTALCNETKDSTCTLSISPAWRGKAAVALSLLFRTDKEFRETIALKEGFLRERRDPGIDSFLGFARALESNKEDILCRWQKYCADDKRDRRRYRNPFV